MNGKVRIGVVGTGRIGRVHIQTIKQRVPEAELVAVTDVNQSAAQAVASEFGVPQVAPDFAAILGDPSIQAVLICSATDTHSQYIIQAAQAGKHIFCEKPIAADLPAIDAALAAVEKAGVKLMIGFNRRFDANHIRIKRAIESGEIGTPHLMHIISRDPAPPPIAYIKVSGGLFFDMTIHDFDMARFLLGEVEEMYAVAGVMVNPEIGEVGDIDTAVITLKFASGAIGTIDNSRQAVYGYDQRVEVFGSAGSVASGNLYHDEVTISTADNIRRGLPMNFFMDRYIPAYQNEVQAFIDSVVNDKPVPVTGYDGRVPVVMAMAGMLSLREHRPVKLAEIK